MKEKSVNQFVVSFRVNNEERNALLKMARKSGVSLSQLMRTKLDLKNGCVLAD